MSFQPEGKKWSMISGGIVLLHFLKLVEWKYDPNFVGFVNLLPILYDLKLGNKPLVLKT